MELNTVSFLLYATALLFFGEQTAAQSSPGVLLTANPPWSAVFPGETITLTCQVIGSEGWTFYWIRHRQGGLAQLPGSSGDGSVLVLHAVNERESGMYQCVAAKGKDQVSSNFHNITASATRPQAVIVTDPPASVMFRGETVTLTCDIRKGSGWRYSWMRKTKRTLESLSAHSTESQQRHILHSVKESDSGEYFCQGERGQNPVIQSVSGSLVLNVSGGKPKPVITQTSPSGEMYTGENVTLNCGFKGDPAGWEYFWYKDRSNILTEGKPKPVITQNAPSREMYTGESVTLSCGFGGDPAGWEYLWYKDTQRTALPNTSKSEGSSYTISPAALAHSGEYRCPQPSIFQGHYCLRLSFKIP
ncbi:Fc receptor-like protein 5 [Conger conger]|uniref:Fc receptor-like protein 5 n=1 Tax=Conger conger TaxID=82655 RepID=UPI002A5A7614|nr:Fc receptor-like protein 5 [Conger conger]